MKNSLTKYEQEIVDKMKSGYVIHSTEGINYKIWLTNGKNEISIRKDTIQNLYAKGYIKEGLHTMKLFVYVLK